MLVVVAYLIGTQSANWLESWRLSWQADKFRAGAARQTEAVLRKTGAIKVGNTLADFTFEDIDGQSHRLSELVTDRTLITYI